MSTIADYSVFTKAFLASGMTDFSQLYGKKFQGEEAEGTLRAFAVIPFNIGTPLTPREAMNFDWSKLGLTSESVPRRVSCKDADGNFIGNIVRVQPGVREGSIRLVAKVAVTDLVSSEGGSNPADATYNTFVLVRTDASTNVDLPIAVATISKGYNLHRHKVVVTDVNNQFDVNFVDPLDDVENANYVSFTINHLNGYTSVDFNPDAYATYDDVANALSRGIDGLHIAFDTASGDLKLLDKDGNVLDQANLPIKTDVIIADGEEGYKYVKTDVKQDIHAAKAWMPEGFTAWETVPVADYEMQKAALVVDKGSTSASKVFVDMRDGTVYPISVVTYTRSDFQNGSCTLTRSSGDIGPETITGVQSEEGTSDLVFKNIVFHVTDNKVEFLVITYSEKPYLVHDSGKGECSASELKNTNDGWEPSVAGTIVQFEGSSRVFVPSKIEGTYPISKQSVEIPNVNINGSIYMLGDVNVAESLGSLFRVKGDAGTPQYDVTLSGNELTSTGFEGTKHVTPSTVEVDVVTIEGTLCVLGETSNLGNQRYRTLSTDSNVDKKIQGSIVESVTSEGSSTGKVLGIALVEQEDTKMYTFGEGVETTITSSSKKSVKWLGKKDIPAGTSLKYGLEAFVWTVKGAEDTINDSFFKQLNDSLLALGFHEGDDIALGTNLAVLAPAKGVSPLNKVDADEYIHGKANKATREQEVDAQRAYAKEELVAWNKQHPGLTKNRQQGTIIDYTGLDVRSGSITLGCGRIGKEGEFQKINYGIRMGHLFGEGEDQNIYDSLDFTISHTTGEAQFDENGHATNLNSSTLLSIEAGSYISGAPTCLILAKVTRKPKVEGSTDPLEGSPVLTPVRMTSGFSVGQNYDESNGLNLTIHDDRENISAVFVGPDNNPIESSPAIIEVQAIYTHQDALNETVPAQQMHTYIGSWVHGNPRSCSFLCNKIEEWMTAIDLADTSTVPGVFPGEVGLYVVIRVY